MLRCGALRCGPLLLLCVRGDHDEEEDEEDEDDYGDEDYHHHHHHHHHQQHHHHEHDATQNISKKKTSQVLTQVLQDLDARIEGRSTEV